jgi:hypothetical protein
MRLAHVLAAVALAALLAAPAAVQADTVPAAEIHRSMSLFHQMAHQAGDAWEAALEAGAAADPNDRGRLDEVALQLFSFYGGARIAAEMGEHHGIQRQQVLTVLGHLEAQAPRVQSALDRARPGSTVLEPWRDARAALSILKDRYSQGSARQEPERRGDDPWREAPPEPAPVPVKKVEGLQVEIQESEWSGSFTPDLILRGTFEGRGLEEAEIVVQNEGGSVLLRDPQRLTVAIRDALKGKDRDATNTVPWRIRLDDDELAAGMNRITVTLKDRWGEEAKDELKIRKRLF